MKNFTQNLESELDSKLHFIALENQKNIVQAELSMNESLFILEKLKKFIIKYKFQSEGEEIDFFKQIKPHFLSKVIYFNKVYNIEMRRPSGGEEIVRQYLAEEQNKIKNFFINNTDFYGYYRSQSTFLDSKYFIRGKLDIKLNVDSFVYESDPRFTTSHDFKVARIMANDMLEVYLKNEIDKIGKDHNIDNKVYTPKVKLNWTDNKAALIELIYALYYKGSFNNGQADIKEIAKYFEAVFNTDLGDIYRSYIEIKNRNSRTKFISQLKEILDNRMKEDDI